MTRYTALHALHVETGAKMGGFAGYDMPLFYALGVKKEHEWVREKAGLFDVSHMGQASLSGPGAQKVMEKLTPSSYAKLGINRTKYTVLTNENGGIIDDLMVAKTGEDEFHMVLNAGCKDKDMAWIRSHCPDGVELHHYDDWALLALQGPQAERVINDVLDIDLSDLRYMSVWYQDYSMFISRLGYTGEDGFEISVPNDAAPALWQKLCADDAVEPIGLAARDSLRLEMGYCLYGHDITENTTPVEADLSWVIGKENTGFLGADVIRAQKENGADIKRVGIRITGKGIAREGATVQTVDGREIGALCSGGFSPTLGASIGQAYVPIEDATPGNAVQVIVRGRAIDAEIAALPFIAPKTKSAKAK